MITFTTRSILLGSMVFASASGYTQTDTLSRTLSSNDKEVSLKTINTTKEYSIVEDDAVEFSPPAPEEPTDYKAIDDGWDTVGGFKEVPQGSVSYGVIGAYIDAVLQNHTVGYAYVINGDGHLQLSNAEGYAKTPDDGGENMSIYTRSFVASVTKQITSVATVKILHDAGLSIETPIANYLPEGWTLGTNVAGLKFHHLLTHSTGWGQLWNDLSEEEKEDWNNDWDGLQYLLTLEASPGVSSSYKNANTALLRILIPQIWVQMGGHLTPR